MGVGFWGEKKGDGTALGVGGFFGHLGRK